MFFDEKVIFGRKGSPLDQTMFHLEEIESSSHSRKILLSRAFLRIIYTTNDRTRNRRGHVAIFPRSASRVSSKPRYRDATVLLTSGTSFSAIRPPRGEVQRARIPPPVVARENYAKATPA